MRGRREPSETRFPKGHGVPAKNNRADMSAASGSIDTHGVSRRRRIAKLLCKAVQLSQVSDASHLETDSETLAGSGTYPAPIQQSDETRILRFLKISGSASPVVIRNSLGLSRSTVYRTLQRLSQERQVRSNGQTRSVVYELCQGEPSLDKIGLN